MGVEMASLQGYTIDFNAATSDFRAAGTDIKSYLDGEYNAIYALTNGIDPETTVSTETQFVQKYSKGTPDEIDVSVTGTSLGKLNNLDLATGSIAVNGISCTYSDISFSWTASGSGVTFDLDTGAASVPAGTVTTLDFSTPKLHVYALGTIDFTKSIDSLASFHVLYMVNFTNVQAHIYKVMDVPVVV